ncbi:hypothetical protein [Leucobacter luti]|uniref:DNA polymerase III subunit gamma/tau n=1 Tax=Leucobacter luti TaxID=340320 RepID=A0A4Q7TZE5_9MICO|nr:hypothetical protein [Leucobacter luti]MBL3698497.1 hypothetical protein [Leucobacter luti]RZT65870.1 hypothetical protein EV139_1291 [Leucobacter luti]
MRKKTVRAPRESALASGWTVEGEPEAPDADEAVLAAPDARPESSAAAPDAAGAEADADGTAALAADAAAEPTGTDQVSNGALVALGVFGGLYLLYSYGWFVVAQAYSAVNAITAAGSGSLGGILQQIVFWAAPFAPALWFFTALALSGRGRTARLSILLGIGAIVLLPLPMLIARGG